MSPPHARGSALALALLLALPWAAASHDINEPLDAHLPDLIPSSARAEGEDERTPTKLCFDAYNVAPPNQGVAGFFEAQLKIDRVINGTAYLDKEVYARSGEPLAGGRTTTFCWDVELPAGRYRVRAAVDTANEVEEESELNNAQANGVIFYVDERPKPNLVIPPTGLTVSPPDGRDGKAQFFKVKVLNLGDETSAPTKVVVRDETRVIGEWDVPALRKGELNEVFVETDPSLRPAGTYLATAVVDPDDLVEESDEDDNVVVRNYTILPHPLPDLSVGELRLNGTLVERRALRIDADVANVGNRSAGTTLFQLQVDGVPVANVTIDRLVEGARQTITFPFYLVAGNHSVRVIADPKNLVAELEEWNNDNSTEVFVEQIPPDLRKANLVIDRLSALPDDPGPGEVVTVNAYVRNIGEIPSTNATLYIVVDGVRIGEAHVPPILPDRYHSALVDWTNVSVGPHTLRATVDALAQVPEIHEDDNNQTLFLTILAPRVEQAPPTDATPPPPAEGPPANATPPVPPPARPTNASTGPAVEITQMGVTTRGVPGGLKGLITVAIRNPRLDAVGRMTVAFKVDDQTVKEKLVEGIPAAGITGVISDEVDLPPGTHEVTVEVRLVGNATPQAVSARSYTAEAGERGIPGLSMWAIVAAAAALALRRKKPVS